MTEADGSHLMIEFLRERASDRKARLFAVACCGLARPFGDALDYELGDVAEAFADGLVNLQQLRATQARHTRSRTGWVPAQSRRVSYSPQCGRHSMLGSDRPP